MHAVIDAARDLIEFLLREHPSVGRSLRTQWEDADVPILRRLALHGYTEDPSIDSKATLDLILVRGWLDDFTATHELFRLLARVYREASEPDRTAFLERAIAQLEAGERGSSDPKTTRSKVLEQYNLVVWLSRAVPESAGTATRLRTIQEQHADIKPREHPDLSHWTSGGWAPPPIGPKSVAELLAEPPAAQIDFLIGFDGPGPELAGPSREGLLQNVKEAASTNFDWGWSLAEVLMARGGDDRGLWDALLRAWSAKPLPKERWERVLSLVWENPTIEQAADRSVVELITRAVEDDSGAVDAVLRQTIFEVAERVVHSDHKDGLLVEELPDWLLLAVNHPAGTAMLAWLRILAKVRAEKADLWTGLEDAMRSRLESVIEKQGASGDRARTILASQTHFLFGLDQIWCRERILPLFDWDKNPRGAAQAWHGYLKWGKTHAALFDAMLPLFEKTYSPLVTDLGKARSLFDHLLADVAIHADRKPWGSAGWLRKYMSESDPSSRVTWAERVADNLQTLPVDAAHRVWGDWLAEYWDERLSGVPSPISQTEGAAMVRWVFGLSVVMSEVVSRLERTPLELGDYSHFFYDLQKSSLAKDSTEQTALLLRHLLKSAKPVYWQCKPLSELVAVLIAGQVKRAILRGICEEMMRAGCPSAADIGHMLE